MSFIEDIGKKVTQAGNDTTQAAKRLSELNRLNAELKAYEKKINSLYTEIGKSYFENCSEEYPISVLGALTDELRQNKEAVENINAKIAQVKGVTICDKCGAEIPVDAVFCPVCGQKKELKEAETALPEGMRQCPTCGCLIRDEAKFCVKCGANLT